VVKENSFEGLCCFGGEESTRGEYKVRAVADGNLEIRKYKILPNVGVQSQDVKVYVKRVLADVESQSNIVGEIESGKFTIRGEGTDHGTLTYSTNLCVRLRLTNKGKSEAAVKRAELEITLAGTTYHGRRMSSCDPREGVDLLSQITNTNPIRHGVATIGSLEFWAEELKCPSHAIGADVSVKLTDEFDAPASASPASHRGIKLKKGSCVLSWNSFGCPRYAFPLSSTHTSRSILLFSRIACASNSLVTVQV